MSIRGWISGLFIGIIVIAAIRSINDGTVVSRHPLIPSSTPETKVEKVEKPRDNPYYLHCLSTTLDYIKAEPKYKVMAAQLGIDYAGYTWDKAVSSCKHLKDLDEPIKR